MKNPLQLELQLKIKKANRFLATKQYADAIKEYTEGLEMYQENRRYNNSVSEQFEALLYSLRGNTYSLKLDSQLAQEDFAKSLKTNPYSAVTLSRRAKHFMKQKRFSEAIQDIDLALLYDPQSLNYLSLLNSIQNYANSMNDQQEKNHISSLVREVKDRLQAKSSESEQEENDESILNFSKLKKIDRKSLRLVPKTQKRKSVIEFKEDTILQYVKDDEFKQELKQDEPIMKISVAEIQEKIKFQNDQLEQLEASQEQNRKAEPSKPLEQFILKKSQGKNRKSILRKSSINSKEEHFLLPSLPLNNSEYFRKSSINAASIKNIDGKIVRHQKQNIKFRPSLSQFSKFADFNQSPENPSEENQKQNFLNKAIKPEKRKSCLRNSNRFLVNENDFFSKTVPVDKMASAFQNIKSIDGGYHLKQDQKNKQEFNNGVVEVNIETSGSDSDDNDEHNIFGSQKKKKVVQIIENLSNTEEIPQHLTASVNLSKKKSILKKDSFLESSLLGWRTQKQKKKSVLFKTK